MTATYDKLVDIDRLSLFLQNLQASGGGSGETVILNQDTEVPVDDGETPAVTVTGMTPKKTYRLEFYFSYENMYRIFSITTKLLATSTKFDNYQRVDFTYISSSSGSMGSLPIGIYGAADSISVCRVQLNSNPGTLYLQRVVQID